MATDSKDENLLKTKRTVVRSFLDDERMLAVPIGFNLTVTFRLIGKF